MLRALQFFQEVEWTPLCFDYVLKDTVLLLALRHAEPDMGLEFPFSGISTPWLYLNIRLTGVVMTEG